jgi:hypothetical protein
MSFAQARHLTALAEHHLESLLGRQRCQIIQFELDFGSFIVNACFQYRHWIVLDQLHHASGGQ